MEIAQSGGRLVKNGTYKHGDKDGNAIWAMEFSKDGRHLAAGGKDYLVRVWAVLSTKEERQEHEKEEDFAARTGESVRLNAPIFKTKTVQEYGGHTASILDLSWSKVCSHERRSRRRLTAGRTTFFFLPRWTKQYGFGMLAEGNVYAVSSIVTLSHQYNFIPATTDSFLQDRWIRSFACGAYQTKVSHTGVRRPTLSPRLHLPQTARL